MVPVRQVVLGLVVLEDLRVLEVLETLETLETLALLEVVAVAVGLQDFQSQFHPELDKMDHLV